MNNKLTPKEIEVLELVAKGYSNNEITKILYITLATLKTHMTSIYSKLNLNEKSKNEHSTMRVKAALYYLKHKWLMKNNIYKY